MFEDCSTVNGQRSTAGLTHRNLHNRVFCPYLRAAWRLLGKKTRFLTTGASRSELSTVNSVQTAAKRDRISVSVYCGVQPSLVVK